MLEHRARELLDAERTRIEELLSAAIATRRAAERAEHDDELRAPDGAADDTAGDTQDAIVVLLRQRLEAVDHAVRRLTAGTFGRSLLSGEAIPDDHLEADPVAEANIWEVHP